MDVSLKEKEIKEGVLANFYRICPGAIEVFMVLSAYASEESKVAKISLKTLCKKTGFSLDKILRVLRRLKETNFIEAPLEGQQGKIQIYKLKA